MRKAFAKKGMFPMMLAAGMLTLAGCGVEDYDLSDLDLTIGIGGDKISIPVSSTDSIMLSNVLNLDENSDVKVMPNGDYVFQMAGENVECAHPNVNTVQLESSYEQTNRFPITVSSSSKGSRNANRIGGHIDETTELQDMIHYEGYSDVMEDVYSVELAPTDITVKLSFEGVRSIMSSISQLKLIVPGYIDLSASDITASQNVNPKVGTEYGGRSITLSNVSTSENLTLHLTVKRLDFEKVTSGNKYGSFDIDSRHNITLTGKYNVAIQADWSLASGTLPTDLYITSTVSANHMTIKKATGILNPDIDFEIGETQVGNIPDFLSDGNVIADLDNPQIHFTVKNDMDASAKIGGYYEGKQTRIVAMKDGRDIASVDLPEISIKSGSITSPVTTSICICRSAAKVSEGYDELKEIPELSTLIKTIPDAVRVEHINARADNTKVSTLEFGHTYTIDPSYEIYAPLAFGEEGCIVYKDTLDGWDTELEDVTPFIDSNDPSKNTAVEVSADIVSRIPAYLTLSIQPIDKDGNAIGSDVIKVDNPETVAASDGKTLTTTSVAARMTMMTEDAMDNFDGIILTVTGSAAGKNGAVTGVTLNSKTQKMKVENFKATLIGKVVEDLN